MWMHQQTNQMSNSSARAFWWMKCTTWEQLLRGVAFSLKRTDGDIHIYMPTMRYSTPDDRLRRYSSMLQAPHGWFTKRFQNIVTLETKRIWFLAYSHATRLMHHIRMMFSSNAMIRSQTHFWHGPLILLISLTFIFLSQTKVSPFKVACTENSSLFCIHLHMWIGFLSVQQCQSKLDSQARDWKGRTTVFQVWTWLRPAAEEARVLPV